MKHHPSISRTPENLLLLSLAVIGLVAMVFFYGRVQPAARLKLSINRGQATSLAEAFLAARGYELAPYSDHNVVFKTTPQHEAFVQAHADEPAQQHARFARHEPAAYWLALYKAPATRDEIRLKIGGDGRFFSFEHTTPPDRAGVQGSQEEAQALAQTTLEQEPAIDWARYTLVDAEIHRQANRTDHVFTWQQNEPGLGNAQLRLSATVQGDVVSGWNFSTQRPPSFEQTYQRRKKVTGLLPILQFPISLLLFIIALIVLILRFRTGEIGIRNGLLIGAILLITFGMTYFLSFPFYRETFRAIIPFGDTLFVYVILGINVVFAGLFFFTFWVSGEALSREVWPEKLLTFDGLFAGRYFFPDLGRSLLRGFSLGLSQLGLWYLVAWLLIQYAGAWSVTSPVEEQLFSSVLPLGLSTAGSLTQALYFIALCPLLLLSLLKRRLKRTVPAVLIALLVTALMLQPTTALYAGGLGYGLSVAVSALMYAFYLRYNLFTIFVGSFVFAVLPQALTYLYQPNGLFQAAGVLALVILGGLLVFGFVARTRGRPLDEKAVLPSYAHYITERVRLKMELDIARRAQLRMLPRDIPRLKGLDIAAFSEPAREVGGDYFDFFPLGENRLGIAIGDVSGKGMPAALYMTLLKGFLQSRAEADVSPREILSHVNRKFYQAAEPNVFVTLFYCVVDLESRKMTFARAGHLPLLLYRPTDRSCRMLRPPGIGIGLEAGPVFDRIIREERVSLQPGDTIVLYTDGLVEARNADHEELGEDRILQWIQQVPRGSSEELLQHIRADYHAFLGREDAHDDLTCLVMQVA